MTSTSELDYILKLLYQHYDDGGVNFTIDDWDKIIRYNKWMVINHPEYTTEEVVEKAKLYDGPVYNNAILFNIMELLKGGKDMWIEEYKHACNSRECNNNCNERYNCRKCSRSWCRCAILAGHVHVYRRDGCYWDGIIRGCDFCLDDAPIFMPHLRKELLFFCPYPDLVTEDRLNKVDTILGCM